MQEFKKAISIIIYDNSNQSWAQKLIKLEIWKHFMGEVGHTNCNQIKNLKTFHVRGTNYETCTPPTVSVTPSKKSEGHMSLPSYKLEGFFLSGTLLAAADSGGAGGGWCYNCN